VLAWRWTIREGTWRSNARRRSGTLLGILCFALAAMAFVSLAILAKARGGPCHPT